MRNLTTLRVLGLKESGKIILNPNQISGDNSDFAGINSLKYSDAAGTIPSTINGPIGNLTYSDGSGIILSQAVDAKRPTNTVDGIVFDNADDFLMSSDADLYAFERTQPFVVFVKIKANSTSSNYAFLGRRDPVNVFRGWTLGSPANNKIRLELVNDFVAGNRISVDSSISMGTGWRSIVATYAGDSNGNNIDIWIDRVNDTTSVVTNGLNATIVAASPRFSVGLYTDGSNFQAKFGGVMKCWGVITGTLNADQIGQLFDYMDSL